MAKGRPKKRLPKSKQVNIRLTLPQHAAWRRAMERDGVEELAEWIRTVVERELKRRSENP